MVSPRAQGYAAPVRSSRHHLWSVWAILAAPSVAAALTWTVSDPVVSPPPDQLAPIAQAWLQGAPIGRWTAAAPGPIDARAVTRAEAGGTIYAASYFESAHAGPIAVRVRCDAAFRVWLDGRLIGGVAQAQAWSAAPIAMPAAVDAGAHRLLVELRPPHDRSALLSAAVTTPTGAAIELKPIHDAPLRPPAASVTPVAISAKDLPSTAGPATRWRPSEQTFEPALAIPPVPDLDALMALPRWPDAAWTLLWDARRWALDTRLRTRRVVGRINAFEGLAAARSFLMTFDAVTLIGSDGPRPVSAARIEVGSVFMATRADALPPDPLGLGAARLDPDDVPIWRLSITLEGPRSWTLAREARGIGGARVDDDLPGRRQWIHEGDAVAAGTASLRVSRAAGLDAFIKLARGALGDHLRPYPDQPACADADDADPLTRAVICAREGADLLFVRSAGRPALDGPVDLADFDAITESLPDWAVSGVRLDGTQVSGQGIARLSVELTPDQPEAPAIVLDGPCGAGPVAGAGTLQTEIDVSVAGVEADPPRSRRVTAGPLTHARHVERTANGWRAIHRLSWAGLEGVPQARVAAACRRLALP